MIILVVNLGLKSARTIAFSVEGELLAQASHAVHTAVSNERVEQDPAEWIDKTWQTLREAVAQLGPRAKDVRYLTVTTSASCLVPLDEAGEPLRKAILVSDSRASAEARNLDNIVEFQDLKLREGHKSSPDLMLPKILWLKRNEPDVFARTRWFVNVGDLLVARLTGRYVTDVNNAAKFFYGLADRSYPLSLYDSLGVDVACLPEVEVPGTPIGKLRSDQARDLGLPQDAEVVLSTYDAIAAVSGTGAFKLGQAVDVSGTVTSFRAVAEHHVFDPKQRVYVQPHVGKNCWLVGGSNNLGGGVIEWLKQLFYGNDADPYSAMEADVRSQPPCPGGLVFLPYLLGERAPLWDPDCRAVFFGMNRSHGRPQLVRSVFDGVGFSVRTIIEVLREFQIPIESVIVSGGLARLDSMNQIKADIYGAPVHKLHNFETTAIGAAILALVGVGVYASGQEAFERFCTMERVFEPDPDNAALYHEFFALFQDGYNSLHDLFKRRSSLMRELESRGVSELVMTENL